MGGAAPPERPLAEKIFIPGKSSWPVYMCVKFQLSISHSSRDIKGVTNYKTGVKYLLKLVPHFGVKVHTRLGFTEEVSS